MYEFERPAHVVYPDAGDLRSDRIRQLYEYWLSKCRDGRLPSRNDIEPGDMGRNLPLGDETR